MPHSCHAEIATNLSLIQLFIVGLSGSFSHCVGMCGPIVISQTYTRFNNISKTQINAFSRLQGAALLPYHFGRITTYTVLGMISYLSMNLLVPNIIFKYVAATFLFIASYMFFISSFKYLHLNKKLFNISKIKYLSKLYIKLYHIVQKLSEKPTGLQGYILGLMLGFLPCGLIYAALIAVSSTSHSIISAGTGMLMFTLGTVPGLFLVSYFGSWFMSRFRNKIQYIAKLIMLFNALMLAYMAFKIII